MSIRWHTDPQYENTPTQKQRELYDLVKLDSYEPLYKNIQKTILDIQSQNSSSEDLFWLKSIENAFDSYVTRVLNDIRMEPWDYEHRIRDEYTKIYSETLPLKTSIRTVMGRLMTYKEIWSYAREAESRDTTNNRNCNNNMSNDWFWRRPEPKPIWKREPRFISGIHPTQRDRVYHVTYEKPWNSSALFSELDPNHNWGVFIDQTRSYTTDAYVRVLMACCAEPVGKTEGCWITLKEDKNAVEGIVKPYRVYHTAFDNIWLNISNNSPLPSDFSQKISDSIQIGTAFQNIDKYEALHKSIKKALLGAAPIIVKAFKDYQEALQATLDANDEAGDLMRDTNPFESILTKEQRDTVVLPLKLRDEFNAIQMLSELRDPKDFVNQSIFKVGDMLKYFTFDKMGGFLLSTTRERITLLKTNTFENVSNLQKIIAKIDKTQGKETKDDDLKELKGDIEEILNRIQMLESQRIRISELQKLDSLFKSFDDVTGLVPATLDWNRMQARLTKYENIEIQIINKQVEVNESIKSLRTDDFVPTTFIISDIIALPPMSADETVFKENMDVAILKKSTEALSIEEVPEAGVLPLSIVDLNNQYLLIIDAYTKTKDNLKDIDLPNPIQEKIRDRPGFKNAKTLVTDTITKQNNFLTTIQKNLKRFAARLRFIDNQTGVSENVKNRVAVDLGFSAKVTASENLREKTQKTKQAALLAYTSELQKETNNYNTEQDNYTKNALVVIKALEIQTKKPIITTDEIKPLFENILQSIESLKTVYALEQQYLNYKNRLEAIFKTLPSKVSVDAAPKKGDYLNAWKTDVLVAASALASALQSLLSNLNDLPQQNALVSRALETFETKLSAATVLIETEADRKAKEAREEAEKLEKERKKREEEERLRRVQLAKDELEVNNLRAVYTNLDNWTKQSGSSFISGSNTGLSLDRGFQNAGAALLNVNVGFKKQLVENNVLLQNGDIPQFLQTRTPSIQKIYVGIYLENSDTNPIEETWKKLSEWLFYANTSQKKQKEADVLKTLASYKQAVPRLLLSVEEEGVLANVSSNKTSDLSTFNSLKIPPDNMFYTETIKWNANSCWLDASFLALFGYPKNIIAQRIVETNNLLTNRRKLAFSDKATKYIDNDCKEDDLKKLHKGIIEAIFQIQQPKATSPVCYLNVRDLWTKCVLGALNRGASGIADDQFNESLSALNTIIELYQLGDIITNDQTLSSLPDNYGQTKSREDLEEECVSRDITYTLGESKENILQLLDNDHLYHVWVGPKSPNILYQIIDTATQSGSEDTRWDLKVDFDNNDFVLYSIICASTSHYVVWLKDFRLNKWIFINVDNNKTKETNPWTYFERDDLTYQDNTNVNNMQNPHYKPTQYLYIRKSERDRLLTNIPAPIPTPLIKNNVFYIYTSGMGDPDIKYQWEKFFLPWIKNNVGEGDNVVINHFDGVTDVQAKYLRFRKEYTSEDDTSKTILDQNKIVDFDTLPGVKEKRYVYFDFGHVLDYKKELSNMYNYVAYPYPKDKENDIYIDPFPPFEFDKSQNNIKKTYIEKLFGEDYTITDVSITLSNKNAVKSFKTINNIQTEQHYIGLLKIISRLQLYDLASKLDLETAKETIKNSQIYSGDLFDSITKAISVAENASKLTSLLPWNSNFQNLSQQEILQKIRLDFNTFRNQNVEDWAKKLGLFDETTNDLITDPNEISDDIILRYAYFHFYKWLSKLDPERPLSEIKIRKALAAAREITNEEDLKLLGIKRYPDDLRKTQLIKRVLLEEVRKKNPLTLDYIKRRKLIFGTRFRINFAELEN